MARDTLRGLERKRQQLLNMHLYRAALDAEKIVERATKRFERLASRRSVAGMDQGHLDRIHQLLEGYGYRVPQANLQAMSDLAAWRAEQAGDGEAIGVAPEVGAGDHPPRSEQRNACRGQQRFRRGENSVLRREPERST